MQDSREYTATVNASGVATVTIKTRTRLQTWTVTQVSVEMTTAPIGSTCELRRNGFLVTPLIGTGDAASGDPPVILRGTDTCTVTWNGATPGDIGRVLIFFDDGNEAQR